MSDSSPQVVDRPADRRYVLVDGDDEPGFIEYGARDDLVAFVSTQVDPARNGQGLGSVLVRAALDDSRARGRAVLPFCPFVERYIRTHPEYADLVPEHYRTDFGL